MNRIEPITYRMNIEHTMGSTGLSSIRNYIRTYYPPLTEQWKQGVRDRINGIKNYFGNRSGFQTFLLGHESDLYSQSKWDIYQYAREYWDSIKTNNYQKPYVIVGYDWSNPNYFDIEAFSNTVTKLRVFDTDLYVMTTAGISTYSCQQTELDTLISPMNRIMRAFKNRPVETWFTLQSQRSANPNFRRPSIYELRVQAYLALSRGAKGINWFVYGSNSDDILPQNGGDNSGSSSCSAILEPTSATYYNGLVNRNRNPWESNHPLDILAFQNTSQVNQEILQLTPIIRKLRVYDAFPNSSITPGNIANITSVSGNKVEIGMFKRVDQGLDSTIYFMLVNRVLHNEDGTVSNPQNVTITFNRPSGSWEVEEVLSHKLWIIPYNGSITDIIDPGKGKLYKIIPAIWTGEKYFPFDVQVQSNATLVIQPGCNVKFGLGYAFTINGKLIANGTSTNRITFTSSSSTPQPGDWDGIVFSGGGPDTLTYCNIQYAENGLRFLNTAANCYMANDTVSNSSGYGVSVSSTGASSTALRVYKSAIRDNRTEGIRVNFARVNVSNSRIENNGAATINSGIFVTNAGRLFIDSSFVTNNIGSGIDVSGNGSRVSLSPDEIKRGYNTVTGHGLSEIYVRNSASALLGYRATINYCICEEDPLDKLVDQFNEGSEIVSKSPACPPGCFPAVRYESRAGWNNVTNNFTYNCRLINNATTNTVQARYNYWGTGSSMFCGPVDTLSQLGSSVNTPAKLENKDMYAEEQFSKEDKTRMREWLIQLKSDIESNNTNSIDALYQLALYVGPGGEFSDALEMPWEFLLTSVERNSRLSNVKSLASVFLVTAKMDRGEFSNAIYIADQILRRNNDDNMWFFCQTQKVIANVGLGNVTNAISLFNAMKSRGEKIDKKSIEVLDDYLKNVSSTTNSNVKMSDNNIQTVQKINIEDSNIERPKTYSLEQCYPNPFNPVTQIKFSIPEAGFVTLRVYDVLGREVATLMDEFKESGYYEIEFNGSSLSSGVYFYRLVVNSTEPLQAGSFNSVKKMLLTR